MLCRSAVDAVVSDRVDEPKHAMDRGGDIGFTPRWVHLSDSAEPKICVAALLTTDARAVGRGKVVGFLVVDLDDGAIRERKLNVGINECAQRRFCGCMSFDGATGTFE